MEMCGERLAEPFVKLNEKENAARELHTHHYEEKREKENLREEGK